MKQAFQRGTLMQRRRGDRIAESAIWLSLARTVASAWSHRKMDRKHDQHDGKAGAAATESGHVSDVALVRSRSIVPNSGPDRRSRTHERQRGFARMKAGRSRVACTVRKPFDAGSSADEQAAWPAPSERAATAYSRSRSVATIARTPRAAYGHPTAGERGHQDEQLQRLDHQRQDRRSARITYTAHTGRNPRGASAPRPPASGVPGDPADHAPISRAPKAPSAATPSDTRAVEQPRQDVAPEAVGAQQKQRPAPSRH